MSCLKAIEISEMEKMLLHIVNFIFRLFLAILLHRKTIFMPMVVVKPHVTSTILFTTIMRLPHISQFKCSSWKLYETSIWLFSKPYKVWLTSIDCIRIEIGLLDRFFWSSSSSYNASLSKLTLQIILIINNHQMTFVSGFMSIDLRVHVSISWRE